jgi:hypothetical protein
LPFKRTLALSCSIVSYPRILIFGQEPEAEQYCSLLAKPPLIEHLVMGYTKISSRKSEQPASSGKAKSNPSLLGA